MFTSLGRLRRHERFHLNSSQRLNSADFVDALAANSPRFLVADVGKLTLDAGQHPLGGRVK